MNKGQECLGERCGVVRPTSGEVTQKCRGRETSVVYRGNKISNDQAKGKTRFVRNSRPQDRTSSDIEGIRERGTDRGQSNIIYG